MEAATDRLVGHLEVLEDFGISTTQELESSIQEVERHRRRVGYEVDPRPIPLDGVGPLRHVPLELHLGRGCGLGQVDLDAVAGGLDVADVDSTRERRGPEPGYRPAAGIERQVV